MNPPLREARSTPYIGPALPDSTGRHLHHYHVMNPVLAKQLVNGAISEENFITRVNEELNTAAPSGAKLTTTTGGVLFNTGGSSSSSTDLSTLIQFYNDSADADITAQWMDLYRAQKHQTKRNSTHSEILKERTDGGATDDEDQNTPAHSRKISLSATTSAVSSADRRATATGSSSENIVVGGGGGSGAKEKATSRAKNYSESAENLYSGNSQCSLSYLSSTSTIEAGGGGGPQGGGTGSGGASGDKKYSINRSMDVLPRSKDQFRLLEKCCSVDLPTQKQMPSARLARSKEMPNIADVDDYD